MRTRADLSAETRRILALAWPVVLTSLNWTILHVTDVVVVGLTGTGEVAALGASRTLTFIGIVMAIGALSGVLVHVARHDGAGDLRGTGRVFHEGLVLGVALGAVSASLLYFLATPMLLGLGVAREIAPGAARVVEVMAFAYPFQMLIVTASFFLEGVSRPRRVAVVNLSILPVNALLAWALSGGHLGLPAMGAAGAALATAIASAMGAAGMLGAAWTLPRAGARGVHDLKALGSHETLMGAVSLARFGLVPAIASGLELAGFSILIALSTQLGEVTTHAFQIVFSIHNLTFAVSLGLGSAAGVRAGNAVGEGVPEQAAWRTGIAAAISALGIGALSLILLAVPGPVVGLFPATGPVHALAAAMLIPWAPFILFDGVQVVLVYALRSLGDQVAAGVNSILAYFIITGGLGLWLVHIGMGPFALVWASGLGMLAAAALHGGRLLVVNGRFRSRS
ncbi:MATE family efflux transporter [Sphingomonas sp. LB-2]|uniref:MATE family efflux transporter n=1 Tax=Sphingomonas caeni TaxID=2984949 RepID=UPI00222EEBC9|nr:MATE family efflux transporter [Sphingomonas caeni]MCW3846886.1 MATE family efflux transporter [Sphingomonas caeni]